MTPDYPYNADSEINFLGAVIASEGTTLDEFPITPEHFFIEANRFIATTLINLHSARAPINIVTLTSKLREADLLERAGGAYAITALFSPAVTAGFFYADLCQQLVKRRLVDGARWALNSWKGVETAEELLKGLQSRISGADISIGEKNEVPIAADAICRRLDQIERGEVITGIETGNESWNKAFGGLVPGAYYALAGRPGTGKSAMIEEMIADMIANDLPVLVFQRDMSPQKMVERLCCRWCGVPYWCYIRGIVSSEQAAKIRETVKGLVEAPLYIYNPVGLTAERLCSIMRREVRIKGIKAVFLDHIQALKVGKDFREGLTQASLTIRAAVTELNIPFVTLCHLNREGGKGERPSASNIKEFDQLYGDVDGMAILWKGEQTEDGPTLVNFYVAKNRDGAETEEQLVFDGAMLKFSLLPKDS